MTTGSAFSMVDPKTVKNLLRQGPGRARLCRKSLEFRHVPQPRITPGVPESTACEHDEANLRWKHWHITLGGHVLSVEVSEIIPATHFPAETSCRILVRTKGFHVISGTKLRVEHIATQTKNVSSLLDTKSRSTEHVRKILSSHAFCEPLDLQSLLSTIPRQVARVFPTCFGAGEESVAVGCQTTALVVSWQSAENSRTA